MKIRDSPQQDSPRWYWIVLLLISTTALYLKLFVTIQIDKKSVRVHSGPTPTVGFLITV
jgi:NADH:ubiquinone oxidoreductase subunit 5 (subunit L)/multisubunit Na+/H+ antiporter MnhA subunit